MNAATIQQVMDGATDKAQAVLDTLESERKARAAKLAYLRAIDAEQKRHKEERKKIEATLAAAQAECPHLETTWNCAYEESYCSCNWCDKEL